MGAYIKVVIENGAVTDILSDRPVDIEILNIDTEAEDFAELDRKRKEAYADPSLQPAAGWKRPACRAEMMKLTDVLTAIDNERLKTGKRDLTSEYALCRARDRIKRLPRFKTPGD